jgi:hypothetical protein
MAIFRFFRPPQHKQFHYDPLYYNERKEQLQDRIRNIEIEMGIKREGEIKRTLGKGSFSYYRDKRKKSQKASSLRLLILIILLILVTYLLFYR